MLTPRTYTDPTDIEQQIQRFSQLAKRCEWAAYDDTAWRLLLLHSGPVSAHVFDDGENLVGCCLAFDFGGTGAGYGMMLISPDGRGQGLAKRLLNRAMEAHANPLQILAVCTDMGAPMYLKMGFERVATVTKLTITRAAISKAVETNLETRLSSSEDFPREQMIALDRRATGLDRSAMIASLLDTPGTCGAVAIEGGVVLGCVLGYSSGPVVVCGAISGREDTVRPLLRVIASAFQDAEAFSIMVNDHTALCLELQDEGFEQQFQLPAMSYGGVALPGNRDQYIAILHPTLG